MLILGLSGYPHARPCPSHDLRGSWRQGWYHDSSAVLLEDGVVLAALEEERLDRCKHSGRLPVRAARACFDVSGRDPDSVDLIAFGEQGGVGRFRDPTIGRASLAAALRSELGLKSDPTDKLRFIDHHVAHALSTYGASGFEQALVFTADGFGDDASGHIIDAHGVRFDLLEVIPVDDSLGNLYGAPLRLLGFDAHDEFKMMGLAPYGDPSAFRELFAESCRLLDGGLFRLELDVLRRRLAGTGPARGPEAPFSDRDRNVAAACQEALERIVFHVLEHFRTVTSQRHLCAAGGVMQNSTLNGKIARSGLFDRTFVQPAASDAGLAIGAAYAAQLREGRSAMFPLSPVKEVYWGRPLPASDRIEQTLEAWSEFVVSERCLDVVEVAAQFLAEGAVVGWVQGRSEFGPRALGNRSILADPRPPMNKDRINELVKKRESFRPFAPAVRGEDAARYFEIPEGADCSLMTFVVPVREQYRSALGATTHVDGSARVQVVCKATNERFWELLGAFGARTDVPILLNTSFNNNHEPIVDSPADALACLLTTGLDMLFLGDFAVRKRELSPKLILSFVPALADGGCLITGPTADGAGAYHAILTATAQVPLSTLAYAVLSSGSSHSSSTERAHCALEELGIPDDGAHDHGAHALAAEILELWRRRLIHLRPSTKDAPDGFPAS